MDVIWHSSDHSRQSHGANWLHTPEKSSLWKRPATVLFCSTYSLATKVIVYVKCQYADVRVPMRRGGFPDVMLGF